VNAPYVLAALQFNQIAAHRGTENIQSGAQILKADEVLPRQGILDVAKALILVHRGKSPWNNHPRVSRAGAAATSITRQEFKILQETL
jgi:hypothetical protein